MSPARAAVLATGLAIVLYLVSVAVVAAARRSLSELPVLAELPELELVGSAGQSVGRSDLLGRLSVLSLLDGRCPDPCPGVLARMRELHGAFAGSDAIALISLVADSSADESRWVLEALKREHDIPDQGWLLLAGPVPEVAEIESLLFAAGLRALDPARALVLLDRDGRVRGRYDALDDTSAKVLKGHVRELVLAAGLR